MDLERSAGSEELAPSSYLQEGMWFSEQILQQEGLLNLCVCVRLDGNLHLDSLRVAFDQLIARHEMLRTTFELAGDIVMQRIHPSAPADFQVIEVASDDAARAAGAAESMRGFDISGDQLLRVRLYRIDNVTHVLLIAMHHLVCDQWSVNILLRDLRELYASHMLGHATALPTLEAQYRHFAAAQRERLQGDRFDALTDFWTTSLAGISWTLDIPAGRQRQARRETVGSAVLSALPAELFEAAERLAKAEHVTLFGLVLAAVRLLLWQHSGQRDVAVGAPMTVRERPEDENLIGLFVNMLVLRNKIRPEASTRELLRGEFAALLDAFEHSDLPYRKLVEVVTPERDASGSPLLRVTVTFGARDELVSWPGLTVSHFSLGVTVSQFDLAISGNKSAAGAEFEWGFNDAVYDAETITRLSERLEPLLRALIADPDRPVREMRALSPADRRQLDGYADRARRYPACDDVAATDVVALVDVWAADTPEAPAARQGTAVVSYSELTRFSRRLAARLAALRLPPETRVGVVLRRTPHLPAVMLGILRSGLCFVPVDIDAPPQRMAFVLTDSGADLVIHDDDLLVPDGPWRTMALSALDGGDVQAAPAAPRSVHPGQLAYVLYTSGSTGTPKGVAITRRALANCLQATWRLLACRPGQRWVAVSNTAFDISLLELFTPLISGMEVIITTDGQGRDAAALRSLLEACVPDIVQATPATWRMLEDAGWRGHPGLTVHTGGDTVQPALADQLIRQSKAFWHTYGPTEATLYCVATPLTEVLGLQVLPLGEPIAGMEVHILDEYLNPVPPGVIGELCIAGAGLARGYQGRPADTAARFVPHPAPAMRGERIYRTGDRALRRFDGRLELRGRIDEQIKLRGFRIELAEIETVLTAHAAVEQAVVLRAGDSPETHRLVAYVRLASEGQHASSAQNVAAMLRAHARQTLPSYMLPAEYVAVGQMPVTVNGKIDRQRLLALDVAASTVEDRAQWSAEERQVAEVWTSLLGVADIRRDDDFFALGGNSLLIVRVLNALNKQARAGLSLWELFEATTVAELAERIAGHRPRDLAAGQPPDAPARPGRTGAAQKPQTAM